jgi:hypothetical protein
MHDRPGRSEPRFPPEREAAVKEAIRARLEELGAGFGYAGAACGSDLLFLEAMAERGGETVVVLPYPAEQFLATSVEVEPTGGWRERFERACERASEVVVASSGPSPAAGLGFDYGNLLTLGLAIIRSQVLETDLVPLALWDGRDSREGTAAAVRRWRERGYDVQILPPPGGPGDDRSA